MRVSEDYAPHTNTYGFLMQVLLGDALVNHALLDERIDVN